MEYSTTNVYIMKRSIIEFGKRIFGDAERSEQKFATDMTYGMLASGSCLLTKIVDALHEKAKKVNAVERLGKHLKERIAESIQKKYLQLIREWIPEEPVVLIDDSDVVKPEGRKFEALGLKRLESCGMDRKAQKRKTYTRKATM